MASKPEEILSNVVGRVFSKAILDRAVDAVVSKYNERPYKILYGAIEAVVQAARPYQILNGAIEAVIQANPEGQIMRRHKIESISSLPTLLQNSVNMSDLMVPVFEEEEEEGDGNVPQVVANRRTFDLKGKGLGGEQVTKMPEVGHVRGSLEVKGGGSDAGDRRRYLEDSVRMSSASNLSSANEEHLSALADVSSVDNSPNIRRRMGGGQSQNSVLLFSNDATLGSGNPGMGKAAGARTEANGTSPQTVKVPNQLTVNSPSHPAGKHTMSHPIQPMSQQSHSMSHQSHPMTRPNHASGHGTMLLSSDPWAIDMMKRAVDATVLLNTTDPEALLTSLVRARRSIEPLRSQIRSLLLRGEKGLETMEKIQNLISLISTELEVRREELVPSMNGRNYFVEVKDHLSAANKSLSRVAPPAPSLSLALQSLEEIEKITAKNNFYSIEIQKNYRLIFNLMNEFDSSDKKNSNDEKIAKEIRERAEKVLLSCRDYFSRALEQAKSRYELAAISPVLREREKDDLSRSPGLKVGSTRSFLLVMKDVLDVGEWSLSLATISQAKKYLHFRGIRDPQDPDPPTPDPIPRSLPRYLSPTLSLSPSLSQEGGNLSQIKERERPKSLTPLGNRKEMTPVRSYSAKSKSPQPRVALPLQPLSLSLPPTVSLSHSPLSLSVGFTEMMKGGKKLGKIRSSSPTKPTGGSLSISGNTSSPSPSLPLSPIDIMWQQVKERVLPLSLSLSLPEKMRERERESVYRKMEIDVIVVDESGDYAGIVAEDIAKHAMNSPFLRELEGSGLVSLRPIYLSLSLLGETERERAMVVLGELERSHSTSWLCVPIFIASHTTRSLSSSSPDLSLSHPVTCLGIDLSFSLTHSHSHSLSLSPSPSLSTCVISECAVRRNSLSSLLIMRDKERETDGKERERENVSLLKTRDHVMEMKTMKVREIESVHDLSKEAISLLEHAVRESKVREREREILLKFSSKKELIKERERENVFPISLSASAPLPLSSLSLSSPPISLSQSQPTIAHALSLSHPVPLSRALSHAQEKEREREREREKEKAAKEREKEKEREKKEREEEEAKREISSPEKVHKDHSDHASPPFIPPVSHSLSLFSLRQKRALSFAFNEDKEGELLSFCMGESSLSPFEDKREREKEKGNCLSLSGPGSSTLIAKSSLTLSLGKDAHRKERERPLSLYHCVGAYCGSTCSLSCVTQLLLQAHDLSLSLSLSYEPGEEREKERERARRILSRGRGLSLSLSVSLLMEISHEMGFVIFIDDADEMTDNLVSLFSSHPEYTNARVVLCTKRSTASSLSLSLSSFSLSHLTHILEREAKEHGLNDEIDEAKAKLQRTLRSEKSEITPLSLSLSCLCSSLSSTKKLSSYLSLSLSPLLSETLSLLSLRSSCIEIIFHSIYLSFPDPISLSLLREIAGETPSAVSLSLSLLKSLLISSADGVSLCSKEIALSYGSLSLSRTQAIERERERERYLSLLERDTAMDVERLLEKGISLSLNEGDLRSLSLLCLMERKGRERERETSLVAVVRESERRLMRRYEKDSKDDGLLHAAEKLLFVANDASDRTDVIEEIPRSLLWHHVGKTVKSIHAAIASMRGGIISATLSGAGVSVHAMGMRKPSRTFFFGDEKHDGLIRTVINAAFSKYGSLSLSVLSLREISDTFPFITHVEKYDENTEIFGPFSPSAKDSGCDEKCLSVLSLLRDSSFHGPRVISLTREPSVKAENKREIGKIIVNFIELNNEKLDEKVVQHLGSTKRSFCVVFPDRKVNQLIQYAKQLEH